MANFFDEFIKGQKAATDSNQEAAKTAYLNFNLPLEAMKRSATAVSDINADIAKNEYNAQVHPLNALAALATNNAKIDNSLATLGLGTTKSNYDTNTINQTAEFEKMLPSRVNEEGRIKSDLDFGQELLRNYPNNKFALDYGIKLVKDGINSAFNISPMEGIRQAQQSGLLKWVRSAKQLPDGNFEIIDNNGNKSIRTRNELQNDIASILNPAFIANAFTANNDLKKVAVTAEEKGKHNAQLQALIAQNNAETIAQNNGQPIISEKQLRDWITSEAVINDPDLQQKSLYMTPIELFIYSRNRGNKSIAILNKAIVEPNTPQNTQPNNPTNIPPSTPPIAITQPQSKNQHILNRIAEIDKNIKDLRGGFFDITPTANKPEVAKLKYERQLLENKLKADEAKELNNSLLGISGRGY